MPGMGTLINVAAIAAGGLIGLVLKNAFPQAMQETLIKAMGVCTLFIGIAGALPGLVTLEDGALADMIGTVRQNTRIPCAVGFGISTPEQAAAMAAEADGVIVGSALVKLMGQYGADGPGHVAQAVRRMKEALRP